MIKVYIASPYTIGDIALNVKRQMYITNELYQLGFNVFWPLHSHFQHILYPMPYEHWTKIDLDWIDACDFVLRLDGESKDTDAEVEYATKKGIPVVYSVKELDGFF
jgi:nucleoside 2-deoxyribosyltransferase